jgi:hypothetical protein
MLAGWAPPIGALYYARPVALTCADGLVKQVTVATKDGLRSLAAAQWIDATEHGLLAILANPGVQPDGKVPHALHLHLYFQHEAFVQTPNVDLPPLADGVQLYLRRTVWPNQRCLTITMPHDQPAPRQLIVPATELLRKTLPTDVADAAMTHCSNEPIPCYKRSGPLPPPPVPARNLVFAVPAFAPEQVETPADRFTLGLKAVHALTHAPSAESDPGSHAPVVRDLAIAESLSCDVLVAGLGTGGAVAALAAARDGARVVGVDLMPFAGGVGSGGGINGYCAGASGGMFEEVDAEARPIRELFGCGRPVGGWHHETKKIVFDRLFAVDGVEFLSKSLVFAVERDGGSLTAVLAATPRGPVRIAAKAFVDATADADLCRFAGSPTHGGRPGDHSVLSFSQVMGRLLVNNDRIGMGSVNYDAGHVDACDSEDLTRGRIRGIRQLLRDRFSALDRPCYVAPVLGLRQSRHIDSERDLTVADLVECRRFEDSVGPTLAFLDTHAVDFEFENTDTIFWLWVARNFRGRLWSELPYRMLIPKGLDNVLVGCRAAGMSTAAAYSTRMEKDIQRLGEAAGHAAALALECDARARNVDIRRLQAKLAQTGALAGEPPPAPELPAERHVEQGMEALRNGQPTGDLWFLYKNPALCRDSVKELLESGDRKVSWLAACIAALWGDEQAEPRLLKALECREQGDEPGDAAVGAFGQRITIPNWLLAVVLLRTCGTPECLPALAAVTAAPRVPLNVRTTVALTVEQLVDRLGNTVAQQAVEILEAIAKDDPPDRFCKPSRSIDLMLSGKPQLRLRNEIGSDTTDEHGWQLHLIVARTRLALGLKPQTQTAEYAQDERAQVRKRFRELTTN